MVANLVRGQLDNSTALARVLVYQIDDQAVGMVYKGLK